MRQYDIILVLPYLFSDHPSFPEGILKRTLEKEGFSVGVIQQPRWQEADSFATLGKPRLFFAVISGPMDSIVLNYTATGKRRREDLYQPEGNGFFPDMPQSISAKIRPDRTTTVFCNKIREQFRDAQILIGGVEASQRVFAHYDFQAKKLRRSILLDSRADLLIMGRGEKQVCQVAHLCAKGTHLREITIQGSARITKELPPDTVTLPSMSEIQTDKQQLLACRIAQSKASTQQKSVAQPEGGRFIVTQPPALYQSSDLDAVYNLEYTRQHTQYKGYSPALRMNLFSITSHRGCGGGCGFCSISQHEGKQIISRSQHSILEEINRITKHPEWRGVISDIGGPSAGMYGADCTNLQCDRTSCLVPEQCGNMQAGQPYLALLKKARNLKGVKKIEIGSGLRYDILLKNPALLEEILRFHAGRFLRVAPEHTENDVLSLMGKPQFESFEAFVALFNRINKKMNRRIELSPYLMIGHPGEKEQDVRKMAKKLKQLGIKRTDVQIFTPTPGTLATAIYYSGISPKGEPVLVEKEMNKLLNRKQILING